MSGDAEISTSETERVDDEVDDRTIQLAALEAENERLRRERRRIHRRVHLRTAVGFVAIALVAIAGGLVLPANRAVLFALGGTGLFAALLTYGLLPERFVSAAVGERIYAAMATNERTLVSELGLGDERIYVPTAGSGTGGRGSSAVLFVPERANYEIPADDELEPVLVVPDEPDQRGVALRPSGAELFADLRISLPDALAEEPAPLATQLTDAVVEQFELAKSAIPEHDGSGVTVGITGSVYGPLTTFDHPVTSFLGTGFAVGLDRPVVVSVEPTDGRAEYLVVCRWSSNGNGDGAAA